MRSVMWRICEFSTEPFDVSKGKTKRNQLTGKSTQMQNVVKLPRNAINLPKPGKAIATTTQAAVTPALAATLPQVFRFSDLT